jgi:hypothetical protein
MKKIGGLLLGFMITLSVFAQVKIEKKEGGILVTENNQKVLFYQVEQKNNEGKYERCNYIHPLWGLDGNVLTEDFPADHLHQRGIFWAWHKILKDGKSIGDGWAILNYKQDVTHTGFKTLENGAAVIETQVDWKSDKWVLDGIEIPYLKEKTTITIHPKKRNYRRIDFEISLLALVDDLQIGGADNEKGYSGFSARIILPDNVRFSGPAGEITPKKLAVQSKGFVNISGAFGKNGKQAGMVIVDNLQNIGYPQKWILRKEKSMQNPVFPGRKPVKVSTKEPLVLKYSLLIYFGELSAKKIEKVFR